MFISHFDGTTMRRFFVCILFYLFLFVVRAQASVLDGIVPNPDIRYHVRLISGDELTGVIVEIVDDDFDGEGIKLKTEIGTATIYASQIAELMPLPLAYPHAHRVFLMPTAEPIRDNLFVSLYELVFLYGGFGLSDFFSVTAGRSFVPTVPSNEQVNMFNAKITAFNGAVPALPGTLSVAVGGNFAYQNKTNYLLHLYGVGTWRTERTLLTGTVFAKTGGADEMTVRAGELGSAVLHYESGTVGLGFGLDTRLVQGRYDLRFIGELWNHEALNPDKVALLLGLRLWNTDFSMDFGLMFFSAPGVAPVANFVWTPRVRNM